MTYQILRDGQTYEPYTVEDLRRYVTTGNVLSGDVARETGSGSETTVANLLAAPSHPETHHLEQAQPWTPPTEASFQAFPLGLESAPGPYRTAQYPLFPVSKRKFIVMSLCTLGIYHLYWAYQSWSRFQDQTREPMMPWARALFAGIWNFALFMRVESRAQSAEVRVAWKPVVLGITVLLFGLCGRLPGAWSIVSLLSFIPYLPVIHTIEQLNAPFAATTEEPPNDGFTSGNWVVIVIGGLVLLLTLAGYATMMAHHGRLAPASSYR